MTPKETRSDRDPVLLTCGACSMLIITLENRGHEAPFLSYLASWQTCGDRPVTDGTHTRTAIRSEERYLRAGGSVRHVGTWGIDLYMHSAEWCRCSRLVVNPRQQPSTSSTCAARAGRRRGVAYHLRVNAESRSCMCYYLSTSLTGDCSLGIEP